MHGLFHGTSENKMDDDFLGKPILGNTTYVEPSIEVRIIPATFDDKYPAW